MKNIFKYILSLSILLVGWLVEDSAITLVCLMASILIASGGNLYGNQKN